MPQINDIHITVKDIQSLNNRDAIYAFLTHLGYDTNNPQKFPDPRTLGITIDSLVREIKSSEQLANNDGFLYVYLFELTSVTIAHTKLIVSKTPLYILLKIKDHKLL